MDGYPSIKGHQHTWSSTKILPFFLPLGNSTPTGVIIFNFGIPSSSSVYTRRFFFTGPDADLVFCCFGGGALIFFEILFLGPFEPFKPLSPLPPLARLDLFRTVLVSAMSSSDNLLLKFHTSDSEPTLNYALEYVKLQLLHVTQQGPLLYCRRFLFSIPCTGCPE